MNEIERLETAKAEALEKLSFCKQAIRDYWLRKHKEDFGIDIGVKVITVDNKIGEVTFIEPRKTHHGSKPWVKARIEKKDGTLGKVALNLYDHWKLIEVEGVRS